MRRSNFVILVLSLLLPNIVWATTFDQAFVDRGSGFGLGNINEISYDGPGFDAFKPFQPFVSGQLLQATSFTGGPGGAKHEFFLISEVAYYDGHIPGLGDNFGVLNADGTFTSVLGPSAGLGSTTQLIQGVDEEFTFALKSPEGMFSSLDEQNKDKAAHIVAMEVTKAGTVVIDHANLRGASMTFNLQVGDIVLFLEDLFSVGNILNNGLASDFDYNDMVVVVRHSAIPEPATMLLVSAGLFAVARRRRLRSRH